MYLFTDFKGFAKARINLFKPMTLLIGPNGSGKSNVIEAVELFSFLARGRSLHEVGDVGSGAALEIRGGLASCARYGTDMFSLQFDARDPSFDGKKRDFVYSVSLRTKNQPRISAESLRLNDPDTLIFETVPRRGSALSGDTVIRYNNFAKGRNKPQVTIAANHSALSQYKSFAAAHKHFDDAAKLVSIIGSYLRASFVFDPIPKLMRAYERLGNTSLSRTGANLSAVLYSLNSTSAGKATLNRLEGWIGKLPDEPVSNFDFVTTKLNDVIFGLKLGGQLVDARMLSDGTLRALAVLTALETVDEGSRIVIEEFDNGVHPSRVQVLTSAMSDCCVRRNLNVLVTTHNPATLNTLNTEQLKGVVFCAWDTATKSFRLVELADLPRSLEFLERGNLGDLVTRRVVEQHLAPDFSENQRAQALEWIKSLP